MSVRVTSPDEGPWALFDSVSGVAFGEVFSSYEDAQGFLDHLREIGERDPRIIRPVELAVLRKEWQDEREDGA